MKRNGSVFLPKDCTIFGQSMVIRNNLIMTVNPWSNGQFSIRHGHFYMLDLPGNPWDQYKLFSFLQQLSKETGSNNDFMDATKNCGTSVHREDIRIHRLSLITDHYSTLHLYANGSIMIFLWLKERWDNSSLIPGDACMWVQYFLKCIL